jgi:type IX secretion system PorP/SprF family membrane protein
MLSLSMITYKPAKAQDPIFTQFYANPLYLNPALAGSNICPRISINYRNEWPGVASPGTYITTSASYDRYIFGMKSGIGVLVSNDNAGNGTLKTQNVSAIYSKQLQVNRNFSINAGFQATYGQKSLDWSKLTFGDMIDERRGFVKYTEEVPGKNQRSFVDFSAGVVAFSKYVFIGAAAHHLTQPDEGLVYSSKLPVKITAHAGAQIPVGDKSNETTVSPNILYQQQQDFRQLNLGMYVTKGSLCGGLWYRNNDAVIVLIGVQQGVFKAGYSYDVTVSKLTNASAGSHEISVGMNFFCKKPKPRYRPSVCPSF